MDWFFIYVRKSTYVRSRVIIIVMFIIQSTSKSWKINVGGMINIMIMCSSTQNFIFQVWDEMNEDEILYIISKLFSSSVIPQGEMCSPLTTYHL